MANLKCGELLSYTSYIVYYGLKSIHNATGHDNGHDIASPIIMYHILVLPWIHAPHAAYARTILAGTKP